MRGQGGEDEVEVGGQEWGGIVYGEETLCKYEYYVTLTLCEYRKILKSYWIFFMNHYLFIYLNK